MRAWEPRGAPESKTLACRYAPNPATYRQTNSHAWPADSRAGVRPPQTMVLAGDRHTSRVQVFHGMVRAMVPKLHLEGLGMLVAKNHDLVTQTNTESRPPLRSDDAQPQSRSRRLWIARTIGQNHRLGAGPIPLVHWFGRAPPSATTSLRSMRKMFFLTPSHGSHPRNQACPAAHNPSPKRHSVCDHG